nr:alpha/beta hydrolase [Cupriavidus basilensis]
MIPTHLLEDGRPVHLQLVVWKPACMGPYPTVVFNHGSTGSGNKPALFRRTATAPSAAKFFNDRGWMVVFPQRRGRGKSGGLYDEGFKRDRSGYACEPELSLPGVDRAIEDLDAAMEHIARRPDVQRDRVLVAGASRGGALAIAYAGERPDRFLGAINFNGGWLGRLCPTHAEVNRTTFVRGAAFKKPTLWLHGNLDQYYRIAQCRANFEAFSAAGGRGTFYALHGGHGLIAQPQLWADAMSAYLATV